MKINRIKAALLYISWSSPFWQWRINSGICPKCGKTKFLVMRRDAFMTRCLRCSNNVNNLAIIEIIKSLQLSPKSSWEMSTYGATHEFLQNHSENYVCSEYSNHYSSGEIIDGTRIEDATSTSFENNSLELITSNQVFEHIPDDLSAFRECYRILKKAAI